MKPNTAPPCVIHGRRKQMINVNRHAEHHQAKRRKPAITLERGRAGQGNQQVQQQMKQRGGR